jgi:hypothetical protein
VTAVLYVRARLRQHRSRTAGGTLALSSHAGGLALAGVLVQAGAAPWMTIPAFTLLLARCACGLSPLEPPVRPQVVGVREVAYGLLFVLALAAGYRS